MMKSPLNRTSQCLLYQLDLRAYKCFYNIGVKPLNGIQYKSYNRKDLKFFE